MKFTKKLALSLLFPIVISMFAGCGTPKDSSKVIHLFNAGDYIDENLLKQFEDETGIQVSMDIFETNEMMYEKVKNGESGYDLIIPSDYMIERMIKEDLIQKINFDNIPNYVNIDEKYKNLAYDPTNEYSVPYFWGTLGIMYNKSLVKEPVTSWNILWDDKYSDQILMLDSIRDSIGLTLKDLGYSLNSTDDAQLQAAQDLLVAQRPLVRAYVGDEVKELMVREEGALAVMYSGDYLTVHGENDNLEYCIPEEGTNKWFDAMVIPTGASNKEGAEKFINFMLDPEVGKINVEAVGYSTPNKETLKLLPPEIANNPLLYPSKEVLDKCEVFMDLGENIAKYDSVWFTVKSK